MTDYSQLAMRQLAEALEVELDTVDTSIARDSSALWDSIAHMRLVLGLEQVLTRQLESDEILAINTLSDIEQLLEQAKSCV